MLSIFILFVYHLSVEKKATTKNAQSNWFLSLLSLFILRESQMVLKFMKKKINYLYNQTRQLMPKFNISNMDKHHYVVDSCHYS